MAIQPTVFSGINNTGSFVIVNIIDQGKVDNFSSIPEGFCLSAQDLQKNLTIKNNKIIPAKNPLFERPDFWANYNWDKTRFSQLNTEMGAYRPVSGTSGLGTSQINYEIMENVEHVSSTGVSSTIVALFSKRPGYVQQFIYKIPSLDTSCYILGKGGGDTGMGTNVAEWCLEFSNAPIVGPSPIAELPQVSTVTKYSINFRGGILGDPDEKFKNFRSNETRGGVAGSYRPEFAGAPYKGIKWYPDTSWSQSPTVYRNYTQGLAPNNVASAALESCVIPFDFISYKGGEDGTVNAGDHGGDLAHPALYRHERYFEKITVNFSGIEGVIHHKMWHHVPRVVPSGEYGQTRYQRDVGPIVPNIFDKAYLYNYYRNEFLDLDLQISGGVAATDDAPYLSATVSSCFRNCTYSEFTENSNLPPVRGIGNDTFTQWSTNIFRNNLAYNDTIWGDGGTAGNPADDPVNGRRRVWLRNNSANTYNGSGLMFFNWEPFINGFNTGNQELADKACYYTLILEKTTGATSFSNPGGKHKPYVASGPFAFGILAKGDTDLKNYYIDNDPPVPSYGQGTGHIIYKGNGLQGDFNEFNWRHSKAVLTSRKNSISAYDTSADGNCLIWHSGFGTVITMGNRDHQKKIPGWGGWQYWIILGKDALEVKEKIKFLIESGAAKTKPVFDVPESIVKSVHPIGI